MTTSPTKDDASGPDHQGLLAYFVVFYIEPWSTRLGHGKDPFNPSVD